jgi:BolA-like protein 1
MKKIESLIRNQLETRFNPTELNVINESHQHAVGPDSETHFKVVIVSESFQGLSLVQRHRQIYDSLKDALAAGVHALSLQAFTPQEYSQKAILAQSPPCLGGSKVK